MKLSDIKGEKALDVVVELIDPVTSIIADKEVVAIYRSNKPRILLIKKMIEKHKKEVLHILAVLNDKDPKTYKPSLIELPMMLWDLLNDEDLNSLFTSQNQMKESDSSGSVTENIEAPKTI